MSRKLILVLGLSATLGLALGLVAGPARAAEPAHPKAEAVHAGEHAATTPHVDPGEETPNILGFELDLAFWTFIVFLLLLVVLHKTAWGPLIKSMHEREEHIAHCLMTAEKARNEGEQLLAQHRKAMADTADEVRGLLDEARRNAQGLQEEILNKARAEAEAEKERAKHEIATARDQALSEIWTKTADLAVSVAGRVLSKEMNEGDHRRLVESAINELPANPAAVNGHGSHTA
jgi:F-type H+-transporting ATPase subunit b